MSKGTDKQDEKGEDKAVVKADSRGEKTVEEWAKAKNLTPLFEEIAAKFNRRGELIAPATRRLNPDGWKFAAAKALAGWPEGKTVSEKEFDEVVHEAATKRIG